MWGSFFSKATRSVKRGMRLSFRRVINVRIGKALDSSATKGEVRRAIGSLLY